MILINRSLVTTGLDTLFQFNSGQMAKWINSLANKESSHPQASSMLTWVGPNVCITAKFIPVQTAIPSII